MATIFKDTVGLIRSILPKMTLCMIVKDDHGNDDSDVMVRCIRSTSQLVDSVVIVGTSQNGHHGNVRSAAEAVCNELKMALKVFNAEWKSDFADARNTALAAATLFQQTAGRWLLLMDADEVLTVHSVQPLYKAMSDEKTWAVALRMQLANGKLMSKVSFIRTGLDWRWQYALHERLLLDGKVKFPCALVEGLCVTTPQDGARSRGRGHDKLRRDADELSRLLEETGDPHYAFYYALTVGSLLRHEMGIDRAVDEEAHLYKFWNVTGGLGEHLSREEPERAYLIYLERGRMALSLLQPDKAAAITEFHKAYEVCPDRPEALGELAVMFYQTRRPAMARLYIKACLACRDKGGPLIEPQWMGWHGRMIAAEVELTLNNLEAAQTILQDILRDTTAPPNVRQIAQAHLTSLRRDAIS